MTSTGPALLGLDNTFRSELGELGVDWQPAAVPSPELIVFNRALADELGLDPDVLASPEGVAVLAGNTTPDGVTPIAMAYAGHQFGGYSPRLGDGRALLLGEVIDADGVRRDLHLKGSGRTPYARGGDGKAALGPMLREFLMAEAMHALGIPTTRALAVVSTGEGIMREQGVVPGAILARVAASHVRVGTFEYAARLDPDLVRRLADYAMARHHPHAAAAERPYLAFLEAVIETQAALVARWMLVGFIHGVMNTDNMTISGETIDYGPCAFMDVFEPSTVYSSIDQGGRYAYGNQPVIAQWNLARLAETLLPLIDDDADAAIDAATTALRRFDDLHRDHRQRGMEAKLGLDDGSTGEGGSDDDLGDGELVDDYLNLLREGRVDYTTSFRALAASLRGDHEALDVFAGAGAFGPWAARWRARLAARSGARRPESPEVVAEAMDAVNPIYIPRNHLVEEALEAAGTGDLVPFGTLLDVLADPFRARPGLDRFAEPAPDDFSQGYRTFCGT